MRCRWSLPIVLMLAASGCDAPSSDRSAIATTATDQAAILKQIGLTLPPSARVEYADYMAGMDDAARLLMTMTDADWQAFLTDITRRAPRPPEFLEEANPLLGPTDGKWNPSATKGLKTGQVAWGVNKSEGLNIGFVLSDDGRIRVFLFWHQT